MVSHRHGRYGSGVRYWAFLANPRIYRIDDALLDLDEGTLTIKGSDVATGDRVLIWKAKGADTDLGVVVLGEVISNPTPMRSGEAGQYFVALSTCL